ncbi:ABC transporter ATP-binding protein [Corynebacterium uterequi]|uniref:ABC-type antimicrobial peptide transport system, ATPase component n=1 Tax=Corynebacterium uterequi TaxID=1072256 RepID=A0A0G3HFP6_9CORY|nr:ATP-binding cassette domain-containing protein [Corynebacterium uterequi]AKK11590.1 ABC-type antimicrobial peptide transport system, ATPase component [Corynebacterium uterequi]
MTTLLSVDDAGKKITKRWLWQHLNFSLQPGEVLVLTGPSGCGKSTLLNCIGLLDDLTTGEIHAFGRPYSRLSGRQQRNLRRNNIGYLFQDFALIDNSSIEANLRIASRSDHRRAELAGLITASLDAVGLAGRHKDIIHTLSGGEQQRVAVARLLLRQPELILADEPTASLDRDNASAVLGLLKQAAHNGAGVIIVSHDPWVISHCDTTYSLVGNATSEPAANRR